MRLVLLTTAIGFFANSALADDQSNISTKNKKRTFSCVVKQTYQLDSSGRLIEEKEPSPMNFSVNRETGKFSDPSWPFFAAPSSQQQILHAGGQGEPFTPLSTNRSAEGGLNVEFLSVKTYQKNGKLPFVAYGVLGNIYSGVCE